MINPNFISFAALSEAIEKRHHAMERFYDIEAAQVDRDANLEILERLKAGTNSREDLEAALDLINSRGN